MIYSTTSDPGLRDIHRLINECHAVLQTDPSCLHTRAVRGHACMKAKLWNQAVRDFSEILRYRPDDVHGRFSRGMALFNCGRVDDAHRDFSRVLELNPSHVMARYARAGCYNSEGEFNQAIQEYTLALQHDEKENAGGFRSEKRRIGMHESAEYIIRKAMGGSARLRSTNGEPTLRENRSSVSGMEGVVGRSPIQVKEPNFQPVEPVQTRPVSIPGKQPRKVVQVRVNLSAFAAEIPQGTYKLSVSSSTVQVDNQPPQKAMKSVMSTHLAAPKKNSCTNTQIQLPLEQQPPRVLPVRTVPKTVRRVTVAL